MTRRVGKVADIRVVEICHFSRPTGAVDGRFVERRADCGHVGMKVDTKVYELWHR